MNLELRPPHEYRANPAGSYVAGKSWLYFMFDETLSGFALWGSPEPDDMEGLVRLMELELDRPLHAGLVDVRYVEGFSARSFAILSGYVVRSAVQLSRIISHTSMVRRPGLLGAIAHGFFGATASPFPVSFHDELTEGFERVGARDPRAWAAALDAARTAAAGVHPSLLATRLYLDGHLSGPSIDAAARAAGVSSRTLQRRLKELGTSFADEIVEARVRAAARLLEETAQPVTTIAFQVGFSSPQHMSSQFRRLRGLTPTEHRERNRRG
jgi:AraC-like DNA-binding protein